MSKVRAQGAGDDDGTTQGPDNPVSGGDAGPAGCADLDLQAGEVCGKLLAYADAIAVIQETSRLLNPAAGQRLVCREVIQRLVDAMAALRDEGLGRDEFAADADTEDA
jgi:hypothetical protein